MDNIPNHSAFVKSCQTYYVEGQSLFCYIVAILKIRQSSLFVLIVLFVAGTGFCADDWDIAMKRARKEDKPVALYFYSAHCPYCIAMDRDVLADKKIDTVLKHDMVYFRIDVDRREDLAIFYTVRAYPTTVFLQPGGENIVKIPGYVPRKDFGKILSFVAGKYYRSMPFKEFLRQHRGAEQISQR